MRRFTRVVLAIAVLAVGAGSIQLRAQSQDPEPAPAVTPEPVEQVIVAPADEPAAPATDSAEGEPVAATVAEEAGIVALAAVVIVARLTREQRESVSIHEDRFPPASSGPPIVRHS